jgi:hypothetical protein
VEAAQLLGAADGNLDVSGPGDVAANELRLAARVADGCRGRLRLLARRLRQIRDEDPGAGGREPQRDAAADAARGAGDDRIAPREQVVCDGAPSLAVQSPKTGIRATFLP